MNEPMFVEFLTWSFWFLLVFDWVLFVFIIWKGWVKPWLDRRKK